MDNRYLLLDSGNLMKLEQVGPHRIVRPALNAFWAPSLPASEWHRADAVFTRDSTGSGKWDFKHPLPESWVVEYGGFNVKVKLTGFGHLGFFAEQFRNWEFYRARRVRESSALNLFAYSGLASIAMAQGGAKVCHLDAARGMNEWGLVNLSLNPGVPDAIRWIADDVLRFAQREVRRGSKYDLIALDPPTFGRGSSGQVWKIETHLPELLECCRRLRDAEKEFTIVLSCHSSGFSVLVLERLLTSVFQAGEFVSDEMYVEEAGGRKLPAGISVRCTIAPGQGRI